MVIKAGLTVLSAFYSMLPSNITINRYGMCISVNDCKCKLPETK